MGARASANKHLDGHFMVSLRNVPVLILATVVLYVHVLLAP